MVYCKDSNMIPPEGWSRSKTDTGTDLEIYTYGTARDRLIKDTGGSRNYYARGGESVIAEYSETGSSTVPSWMKSYVFVGSRLLSTITKSGSNELTEYKHPDRRGTKLTTDTILNTAKEQATLPFGAEITAETTATSNRAFTSYDRSDTTGLDYAVNRTYNSGQSRFTQVDPIGMSSATLGNPQSLNLFAYVGNNPVDFVDPSGLYRLVTCSEESNIYYDPREKSFVGRRQSTTTTCKTNYGDSTERADGRGRTAGDDCNAIIARLFGGKGARVFTKYDFQVAPW